MRRRSFLLSQIDVVMAVRLSRDRTLENSVAVFVDKHLQKAECFRKSLCAEHTWHWHLRYSRPNTECPRLQFTQPRYEFTLNHTPANLGATYASGALLSRICVLGSYAGIGVPTRNRRIICSLQKRNALFRTGFFKGTVGAVIRSCISSSSDGDRKPPPIPDRHKAKAKAEKCANHRRRGGRSMQHLSDHHGRSASQGSNGIKVSA